jgi:hypothetical protein
MPRLYQDGANPGRFEIGIASVVGQFENSASAGRLSEA